MKQYYDMTITYKDGTKEELKKVVSYEWTNNNLFLYVEFEREFKGIKDDKSAGTYESQRRFIICEKIEAIDSRSYLQFEDAKARQKFEATLAV